MTTATAPRVVLVPTARPTFAVDVARSLAADARALLVELGAEVVGPEDLVMTPEDVEAAKPFLADAADLVVNVCASFSDATPALELYGDLDQPVLLWSFREPGPVGDRLWLNSMCGANLFGHALVVHAGRTPHLVLGNPDEPRTRRALAEALAGHLPERVDLPANRGPRADAATVVPALESLRGRRLGLVGDAPPGFTPSQYDGALVTSLFGIEVEQLDIDAMFDRVRTVDDVVAKSEYASAVAAQPSLGDRRRRPGADLRADHHGDARLAGRGSARRHGDSLLARVPQPARAPVPAPRSPASRTRARRPRANATSTAP